jgi:hypothetical protein
MRLLWRLGRGNDEYIMLLFCLLWFSWGLFAIFVLFFVVIRSNLLGVYSHFFFSCIERAKERTSGRGGVSEETPK